MHYIILGESKYDAIVPEMATVLYSLQLAALEKFLDFNCNMVGECNLFEKNDCTIYIRDVMSLVNRTPKIRELSITDFISPI